MAVAFCPQCGARRVPEARFCGSCGTDLDVLGPAASAPAPTTEPPASSASLAMPPGRPLPPEPPAAMPGVSAPTSVRRRSRGPIVLIGALAIIAVVASTTYLLLVRGQPTVSTPSGIAALPAPSLDPDAPAFPVPAGATLLNARVEGSGPAAYRLAAWNSPLAYDATVAFYAGLADPRWQPSGPVVRTPQAANSTFSDGQGVFVRAEVTINRTEPVRIAVQFVSTAPPPAPASTEPGPTIAFGPLPAATALPAGFPAQLVPPNGSLVDTGSVSGTFYAIFASSSDIPTLQQAYQASLQGYAQSVATSTQQDATVIDFTTGGRPGQIVLASDGSGTTVSIAVSP